MIRGLTVGGHGRRNSIIDIMNGVNNGRTTGKAECSAGITIPMISGQTAGNGIDSGGPNSRLITTAGSKGDGGIAPDDTTLAFTPYGYCSGSG